MIGQMYSAGGQLTRSQELGLKIAAPIGNLFGQVLFGWLADVLGRKKMYGVELLISKRRHGGQSHSLTVYRSLDGYVRASGGRPGTRIKYIWHSYFLAVYDGVSRYVAQL